MIVWDVLRWITIVAGIGALAGSMATWHRELLLAQRVRFVSLGGYAVSAVYGAVARLGLPPAVEVVVVANAALTVLALWGAWGFRHELPDAPYPDESPRKEGWRWPRRSR